MPERDDPGRHGERDIDETSDDAPATETGCVSSLVNSASWSASPSTVTTAGSTTIDAISKPAAGVPVTTGRDRERRDSACR